MSPPGDVGVLDEHALELEAPPDTCPGSRRSWPEPRLRGRPRKAPPDPEPS